MNVANKLITKVN